ncbi:hypothetical protein KHS38_00050 [Mucilaginibacter sp. Bleaf8]|uniref:FAD-dependent oxidoreductase n=1 Tax=Mucilaginibacter sp. Bleaf8 TaxID=2834430 RepID=UPI001BCFC6C4|nr:hypothetical protein [Mucilaginibacter sp. Bleaf8]MBS7562782.1 hypothetical protein [Mucilaginibacter sp. Bleaf8]
MIGDAAHQTPPSRDGVNQAMLDALELSQALCANNFLTIEDAISSYEKNMLARTSKVTAEALQLVEAMLAENNLQEMVDFFKPERYAMSRQNNCIECN